MTREQVADDREQVADDREQVADDREQVADDREQVADAGCKVRSGGCDDGESGETMPEVSQGRIVGHDSNRVIDDLTNDSLESCRTRDWTRHTDRTRVLATGGRARLPA